MPMTRRNPLILLWQALGSSAYQFVVPAAALSLFAAMAFFWLGGFHRAYFSVLHFFASREEEPFATPFLDMDYLLATAQCSRHGFDVYLSNPCDALGRLFDYSPLWLIVMPRRLGSADTLWLGALVDVAFLSSLLFVMRPRSPAEAAIFGLAVFSPATLFALERANSDLLIFLLILYGSAVDNGAPIRRGLSYLFYLTAGLLKYYPLVLLILLVRHRRRVALLYGGAMVSALLAFAFYYRGQIIASLANVPESSCIAERFHPSFVGNAFGAKNLPFGLACRLGAAWLPPGAVAAALFLILSLMTLFRIRRTMRSFAAAEIDWHGSELQTLALASLLIASCFFAGTSLDYREIYFLLAIPGLLELRSAAKTAAQRRLCSLLCAALPLLMWGQFIRQGFSGAFASAAWAVRELLWWWVAAAFAAIALSYLTRQPFIEEFARSLRSRIEAGKG